MNDPVNDEVSDQSKGLSTFRVMASNARRLPNGDYPMFDVVRPPKSFVNLYLGKLLDDIQLKEARQLLVDHGYVFSVNWLGHETAMRGSKPHLRGTK